MESVECSPRFVEHYRFPIPRNEKTARTDDGTRVGTSIENRIDFYGARGSPVAGNLPLHAGR